MSIHRHAFHSLTKRSQHRHEAGQAGGAALRGALILLVALGIGIFLVRRSNDPGTPTITRDSVAVSETTVVVAEPGTDTGVPATTLVALRAPEVVKVLVANGSGVNRAAARVRAFLVPLRFDLPSPADAMLKNYEDYVYFNAGFEIEAKDIAAKLGIAKAPIPVPANVVRPPVPAFDVLVMVGPDLAVRFKSQPLTPTASAPASAPAAAVATTVPAPA